MSGSCSCPSCGSWLVQPLRCRETGDGRVLLALRCPECWSESLRGCSSAEAAAIDAAQRDARQALVAAHERAAAEALRALDARLGRALALDLVTADDFAPPAWRR